MNNLRDKGYPQSRTEKVNKSDKRDALLTSDVQSSYLASPQYMGSQSEPSALDKLINAYNNKAYGTSYAPMISKGSINYTDNNDNIVYDDTMALNTRGGNRLGFVGRDFVPGGETTYRLGVDNLPLGSNYYSKDINTPLGNLYAEYDGDGTASASFTPGQNAYYLQALAKALMNRGTL